MKKSVVAVALIGTAMLVTPVVLGHFIEQETRNELAELTETYFRGVETIKIADYDRGLYSSEVTFDLKLVPGAVAPDGTQVVADLTFPLVVEISHGPLALDAHGTPRLAWATLQARVSGADIIAMLEDDPTLDKEAKEAVKGTVAKGVGTKLLNVIGKASKGQAPPSIVPEAMASGDTETGWDWEGAFLAQLEEYPGVMLHQITGFDGRSGGEIIFEATGEGEPTAIQPVVWGGGRATYTHGESLRDASMRLEVAAARVLAPDGVEFVISESVYSQQIEGGPQTVKTNAEFKLNEMTARGSGGDPSKVVTFEGIWGKVVGTSDSSGGPKDRLESGEVVLGFDRIRFPRVKTVAGHNVDEIGFTFGVKYSGIDYNTYYPLLTEISKQSALQQAGYKQDLSETQRLAVEFLAASAEHKPSISLQPMQMRLGDRAIDFDVTWTLTSFDEAAFAQHPMSVLSGLKADAHASAPTELTTFALSQYIHEQLQAAQKAGQLGDVSSGQLEELAQARAQQMLAQFEAEGLLTTDHDTVRTVLHFDGENLLVNGNVLELPMTQQ